MNVERLQTLANLLDTVPEDLFDIRDWGNPTCGYAGCACGWAATIPEFQKAGLSTARSGTGFTILSRDPTRPTTHLEGWEAVRSFFDLDVDQSQHLFFGVCYSINLPTPRDVADRIRKMIGEPVAVSA